jgi:hypothetical protein
VDDGDTRMVFLVVRAGDEAVTVASVEPQDTAAHVVYWPGTCHPSAGALRASPCSCPIPRHRRTGLR